MAVKKQIDTNYISHAESSEPLEIREEIINVSDWKKYSDLLKFSNRQNVVVINCTIYGGKEDCVDINRLCENIRFFRCRFIIRGKRAMTIKASGEVGLKDCVIEGHGKNHDIQLGNYTHTGNVKTYNIHLENVTATDGKPVIVNVMNSQKPKVIGGNVKVTVMFPLFWRVYFFLRDKGIL